MFRRRDEGYIIGDHLSPADHAERRGVIVGLTFGFLGGFILASIIAWVW